MKSSAVVNFSTGPVNISKEVHAALASAPISHRSKEFAHLFAETKNNLCAEFNTKNLFLLTGSGTLANEVMIGQIKNHGGTGLILSNGEFGLRLKEQARRASLHFINYDLDWGETFDLEIIENKISQSNIAWVLFCHCETSTGVVNDLQNITSLCTKHRCLCFVDCMSTIGMYSLDLSTVSMATASSGKGFASVPGLSVIFSNIEPVASEQTPMYVDLFFYTKTAGIPFTISSNLISALHVSAKQKLRKDYFEVIDYYVKRCHKVLSERSMLPFCNENSHVLTMLNNSASDNLVETLKSQGIIISFESAYLIKRDLCQLAFFGYYESGELKKLFKTLQKVVC